ncbi:hypothetical protein F2Q68_00040393 [Brassica cretica]|uniref:rRNA methyltransferase n=1 Tax=Brassica cretica TaxID=69181 RepID=A0A8S9MKK5_BRACR|nr:hypothetical protein F2Q68_00040393 [Brassica cretica]
MGKAKYDRRLDKYYRLAKQRGFRSRASYKLIQINAKHSLLHKSHAVLDLCAAPGGWMQVAVEKAPFGSLVLGIDLVPIIPVRGCVAIQQDITRPECRSKIKQVMEKHGVSAFDLVLHDGSPNLGGAWSQELMSQNALVIDSVKLATEFLAPRGNFITKVFRSRDYHSVRFCLRELFEKVEELKPPASRSTSSETYLLGLNYKAPAKIDPRHLDYRHLFKETAEPTRKVVDVLGGSKQKRNRDGYEDGESILRKVASAADFIWSENPLEILGTVTCISFDDQASLPLKEHDLTTEEIKILCDDLPVLGKNDFKHILKWRMQIRKALTPEKKEVAKKEPDVGKEDEENEDDRLLSELEELTNAADRKKKQAKKLLAKRRAKAEMLACAKKMLKKKQREEMLDDTYNRHMLADEGLLPKWFLDDEKHHRQPMKPITKEEANAVKAQFREINARPAKKVAEAKARKKRAAAKRFEKVRKKANVISDTADISNRSKDKMIDKLYKKAAEPRKAKKELVVSKKGVGVKVGKGQKRVDRRMKSDARQRRGGKPGRKGMKSASGKSGQKGKKTEG